MVCTGDLTMRGTAKEFAAAAQWLGSLAAPVTVEPGNHDVPYYWYPLRRMFRPYAHFHSLRSAVQAGEAHPHVTVVSLKSIARAQLRLNWSKGTVRARDIVAAVTQLEAESDKKLRLVACHHPLIEADTQATASTRGGKRALAALAAAGADAVLSGHVHDAFDREVEAGGKTIRIIGAGTLSERLRSTPPSYNRLEWAHGRLSVEPVRFG